MEIEKKCVSKSFFGKPENIFYMILEFTKIKNITKKLFQIPYDFEYFLYQ
jgi:hypothetical protein